MATFSQIRDEMKTCPYNPLHKVSSRRLQQHIIKCSKNPDNPVLRDCPFNALHKIPANQLQQHILLCKDSRQIIREIEDSRNRTIPQSVVVRTTENPLSSDDWDQQKANPYVVPGLEETQSPDEDQQQFAFKTNIEIQRMKPAERKKYYKEMVEKAKEKLSEVDQNPRPSLSRPENDNSLTSSSSSGDTSQVKIDSSEPDVRKPNRVPEFAKFAKFGIGRGSITPISGSKTANRQTDIGRGTSSGVKREREDDLSDDTRRSSPDLR